MKKKILIFVLLVTMIVCMLSVVSFADGTETDYNAEYYEKVYTTIDGTQCALYEKEEIEGVVNYYPLVWFSFDVEKTQTNEETGEDEVVTETIYVKVRYDNANPGTRQYSQGRFNSVSYSYTYEDSEGTEQTVELTNANVVLLNLRDAYVVNGTNTTMVKNFESSASDPSFTRMEAIYFPVSISSVSNRASTWSSIKVVDFPKNLTQSCSINKGVFNSNKSIEEFYVSANLVFTVDNSHFQNCSNLKKVTFAPEFNNSLSNYMFQNCTSLVEVNQNGATFTKVGSRAFEGCTNENLSINLDLSNTTSFGEYAFNNCKKLTIVNGDITSATSLGQYCFSNCKSLTYIKTGAGLTNLGRQSFNGCTGLLAADLSASNNPTTGLGHSTIVQIFWQLNYLMDLQQLLNKCSRVIQISEHYIFQAH